MRYFVTFKVDRRAIDADNKLLEFKYRYNGEYVATVQIDLIKKSYEVVDGSFDGVAIPDENIPPGQTREDTVPKIGGQCMSLDGQRMDEPTINVREMLSFSYG